MTKHFPPITSEPEHLDRPVDADIRITTKSPCHKLELIVDGEPVSWTSVVDFQQQIGSRTVRMGGIGGVGTHNDHRLRGYSRRVMENSLRWMRRLGFDTAMLFGIRNFYPKFGYAPAFPNAEFSVAVRDGESVNPAGYRFVDFGPEYLRDVIRMYHASNAGRTGPIRRDAKRWPPFRKGVGWNSEAFCRVAIDRRDRPAGYFVCDARPDSLTVIEVGFTTTAIFADILRTLSRFAWRRRLENIHFILPEDDAFVGYCRLLGARRKTTYRRDGGCMVRMINITSALRKVGGELGRRMSADGRLTIRTDLDSVSLEWSGGNLAVGEPSRSGNQARMPQWALAQMLYGYVSADSLAGAGQVHGSKDAIDALNEMFPVQPHFFYAVDEF